MEKKLRGIKKFFDEFKKFISRGNVLDMAVGVIVGGAFTGIVNGMSNYILKPIINKLLALIFRGDGLAGAVTYLERAYKLDEAGNSVIDLQNSIYIDWGAFISSIINFLLVAFTLFVIVRAMNRIAEMQERALGELDLNEKRAIAKIKREQKISYKEAKAVYDEQVKTAEEEKAEAERLAAEAAEKAAAEAEAKATANTRLLEEIRDLLKKNG